MDKGVISTPAMGPVDEILQRAADRSKRRAELEVAKGRVERFSGYELADDQFGWLSVLSMPYHLAGSTLCTPTKTVQLENTNQLVLHTQPALL